jgi:ribosomal protein S18 acetylase RimI-like enzyme
MIIQNSTLNDLQEIFALYNTATEYQKIKFPENQWPVFNQELIKTEIAENRQWKIIEENKIASIWAHTFSDPQIWEERYADPAIYIHRIATNPTFRGRNYVSEIVKWSREFAKQNDKKFIRLDTCGDNKKLIAHYINCGFDFLGMKRLKNSDGLPSHYANAEVCFFEIKLMD